ncbi:hypothetical protein GZ78_12220 [Endozoicomonas numazuensis]|uniref:Uncharacterized protein n=2 Tax=Endozoicomonas numazuensis TaxID=1137799 RepID=A0A081NIK9_9GAMM|nr:hypothetical protein GZ78_12220 [Endozoicomonas numazuensis]
MKASTSRFTDRVEQVQDNVVKLVTERHPTLVAISIVSKQVAGEWVAEQVDLLDRATGRVVVDSWNNLDPNLRDELNGLLKVASVVPVMPAGVGLRVITGRGKYLQDTLAKAKPNARHLLYQAIASFLYSHFHGKLILYTRSRLWRASTHGVAWSQPWAN